MTANSTPRPAAGKPDNSAPPAATAAPTGQLIPPAAPAAPQPAEPPAPPRRTASVWDSGNGFVLQLDLWPPTGSVETTFYLLRPLASDWGRAFELIKVTDNPQRNSYHVNLAADGPSCDCPDFQFRHAETGACKHLAALISLQARGKLDQIRPPQQPKPQPAQADVAWEDL